MKRITRYSVELVKDKTALYDLETKRIKSPADGYEIIEQVFSLSTKPAEHVVMLCLNTKNEVIGAHTLHIGSINVSIVGMRDIFQRALLNNASQIVLAHNHPSNDTKPSNEDYETTQRLIEAGRIMGVHIIDHLVIGEFGFTSIREESGEFIKWQ